MKKELKAILCVVLSVWIFVMGFELGIYHEKRNVAAAPTTTETSSVSQTQESTPADVILTTSPTSQTEITTELPTAAPVSDPTKPAASENKQPSESAAKDDVSKLSKAQIIQRVSTAINNLKKEQNFKARQVENTTITVTDCSVQRAVGMINNIISGLAGEDTANYNFVNGQATGVDDSGKPVEDQGVVSPKDVIPPTGKDFTLTEAGVVNATAVKEGNNIVYTLKLAEESTTINNPVPNFNSQAIGFLDLTSLDLPGVTISDANMHYPGSTVTVTVDGKGRVISIHDYLPMDGSGAAKLAVFSGNASFEGANDEYWEFSY